MTAGELITETFAFDGGRKVTVYVPAIPARAILFTGDGQGLAPWGGAVAAAGGTPTMIVGVHRVHDEERRIHEYSPSFDPPRFAAHEQFLVGEVRDWVRARFGVDLPRERTAAYGVSASGELALALALRHPDIFGVVFCASPGGGYRPTGPLPQLLPRAYFTGGTEEPWFFENASRWAEALRAGGADVTITEREGGHGGAFWRDELPLMVKWAFAP